MIKLVTVGKIKEKSLVALIEEYQKRISGFTKLEIIEVNESKIKDDSSEKMIDIIKKDEAKSILKSINLQDFVCLLDLRGKAPTSEEFAAQLQDMMDQSRKDIIFIIGGSYGVSEEVVQRSNLKISFSKMTFPHQLMRLFLIEQIYRGFMINEGRNYHK